MKTITDLSNWEIHEFLNTMYLGALHAYRFVNYLQQFTELYGND